MAERGRPPLALTMGEPAGVGLELALAAWRRRRELDLPPFFLLADPDHLAARARALRLDVPIRETAPADAGAAFADALPVAALTARATGAPGKPVRSDAAATVEAIRRAVELVRAGEASAVVTNPISKEALYGAGFAFPGHTEFLGALATGWPGPARRPVMMIAGPDLRTVPVTIHIPLAEVPRILTTDLVVETGRVVAEDLVARFAIATPRLAIAGLNPHAGEGGTIGGEDEAIVRPAVAALRAAGIEATGPHPADTLFHARARSRYDVALCMYHDQALIPAKTLAFDEAVNVTLGLPFIRTSPDHGTAFDIAGTGTARPDSLIAAIRLAARLAAAEARR